MSSLQEGIELAFSAAENTQDPRMSNVKLALQQAAAHAGLTDLAFSLRGRISQGAAASGGTRPRVNRFSTIPPKTETFVSPNLSAAAPNAEVAASEEEQDVQNEDGANAVYAKIANMSPSSIVSTYGESAIERMIVAKGGDLGEVDGKKPNQKAAYLKSLCAA